MKTVVKHQRGGHEAALGVLGARGHLLRSQSSMCLAPCAYLLKGYPTHLVGPVIHLPVSMQRHLSHFLFLSAFSHHHSLEKGGHDLEKMDHVSPSACVQVTLETGHCPASSAAQS